MGDAQLSNIAQKRLMVDINEFHQSQMETRGIYIHVDEQDISTIIALIIGPADTPYEGGFYFFHLKFPYDYPFNPPVATFLTRDPAHKVRFHPNFYVKGKVCLSMLNTWDGPGWSAVQSLKSVLMTIQSVMDSHPLRNEPQFDKYNDDDPLIIEYDRAIEYHNLALAVDYYARYTRNIEIIQSFADTVEQYFLKNLEHYQKLIKKYEQKYGTKNQYWTHVYQMATTTDYQHLNRIFEATRQTLLARWPELKTPLVQKLPKPKIVPRQK